MDDQAVTDICIDSEVEWKCTVLEHVIHVRS